MAGLPWGRGVEQVKMDRVDLCQHIRWVDVRVDVGDRRGHWGVPSELRYRHYPSHHSANSNNSVVHESFQLFGTRFNPTEGYLGICEELDALELLWGALHNRVDKFSAKEDRHQFVAGYRVLGQS